jgi:hypothetical protein
MGRRGSGDPFPPERRHHARDERLRVLPRPRRERSDLQVLLIIGQTTDVERYGELARDAPMLLKKRFTERKPMPKLNAMCGQKR